MTEQIEKPQRDLTDNRISLWLRKFLPERSPYVVGLLLLAFFALLPAMLNGDLPNSKYLQHFGSYVGAVIGLGGLAYVTFWKHQKEWERQCWEEDHAQYLKVQALVSQTVHLLQSCATCLRILKNHAGNQDDAEYVDKVVSAFELAFPRESEWLETKKNYEGVSASAQMYLVFCIGRAGEIWRMLDALKKCDGPEDAMARFNPSLSVEICEKVIGHLETAIERLTGEAHFLADSIGIDASVLVMRDGSWTVSPTTPDPKYVSLFKSNRPKRM